MHRVGGELFDGFPLGYEVLAMQTQDAVCLRCATPPDAVLLDRLSMVLPKHLRMPEIGLPAVLTA